VKNDSQDLAGIKNYFVFLFFLKVLSDFLPYFTLPGLFLSFRLLSVPLLAAISRTIFLFLNSLFLNDLSSAPLSFSSISKKEKFFRT